jgi:hypothetical protein
MKQGSLFWFVFKAEISQIMAFHVTFLVVVLESFQWERVPGAPTWFETVWSYSVEDIDLPNHFHNEN